MDLFYGTAVLYCGFGILIRGPSGSGKSDLALRLIDDGADLIADDQVIIKSVGEILQLSSPDKISGLIEIRGVGVVRIKYVSGVPLGLILDINPRKKLKRMPITKKELIGNISIPVITIDAFESSAVAKIKVFIQFLGNEIKLLV